MLTGPVSFEIPIPIPKTAVKRVLLGIDPEIVREWLKEPGVPSMKLAKSR
jgi:hypothetical protein